MRRCAAGVAPKQSSERTTNPGRGRVTSGGDLTEEEHEVTLSTETPFIEKDVVAKQRVRLDKDTVTEEAQVDESVRKEQIDTGGDTDAQR